MANAVIDTLKAKNASDEEVLLYPRTKLDAIIDLDQLVVNGGSGFNDIYAETSINLGRKSDTEIGNQSVAIGVDNTVVGVNSIAVGENNVIDETKFTGNSDYASNSIIVGANNIINNSGEAAVFGDSNQVINSGNYSYWDSGGSIVSGKSNIINNNAYHAVFGIQNKINLYTDSYGTNASSYGCLASGYGNEVSGRYSVGIGYGNNVGNNGKEASIALGRSNKSTSTSSIALGSYCEATGQYALAGGYESKGSGISSFAYGDYCETTAQSAIALGYSNKATAQSAFATGYLSNANGYTSIAMGYQANATGSESIAIGSCNEANASQSLALGTHSIASDYNSIAIGYYTKASSEYQTVLGKYNEEDSENKYALIFGGGDYYTSKNLFTLDWDGNAWFSGNIVNKNGEDVGGIDTAINSNISTSIGGNVVLNISGTYEQDMLNGFSLYKFEDKTVTQNGVTAIIKDNVYSWGGTPTVSSGAVIYNIYLDELDLSILTEGNYIYGTNICFDVYGLDGSLLQEYVWKYQYSSATVGKIIPHLKKENFYYEEGSAIIMIFEDSRDLDYDNKSKITTESYVGRIPSPNPIYSQPITSSSISSIVLKNENGNKTIDFGEEITLRGVIDAKDTITSSGITQNVVSVILTGNEDNLIYNSISGVFILSPTVKAKPNSVNILSDHYMHFETDANYNISIIDTGDIVIRHDDFTTIEDYKAWLVDNNVEIVYERETPVVTPLSGDVAEAINGLTIYAGETTVTTDSTTVQPTIGIEYPTSKMGKYVLELLSIIKNTKNAEGGAY